MGKYGLTRELFYLRQCESFLFSSAIKSGIVVCHKIHKNTIISKIVLHVLLQKLRRISLASDGSLSNRLHDQDEQPPSSTRRTVCSIVLSDKSLYHPHPFHSIRAACTRASAPCDSPKPRVTVGAARAGRAVRGSRENQRRFRILLFEEGTQLR